jgi:alpha-L-rhamnosidase
MYQQDGDTQILDSLYPSQQAMMTWYAHYLTPANDYEYSSALAVYSAAGSNGTSGTIIDNLEYYWYFANYMANVAGILQHPADKASYRSVANGIEQSLITHFWSTAGGAAQGGSFVSGNIESENALALGFGMVADGVRRGLLPATAPQTVANAIAYDVENIANTHIDSGVEGIAPMFAALTQSGYANLAYQLATQTTSPSYGYQIAQGDVNVGESGTWTRPA